MSEEGKVIIADIAGGAIVAHPPSPVNYDAIAVKGPMPRQHQIVCFDRNPNAPRTALSVRIGTCAAAALASELEIAFYDQLGGIQLADDGQREALRISADRAKLILRPSPSGDPVPEAVKTARLALATAAMVLMATEVASMAEGPITAKALRDVVRGQRPRLPR